MPRSPEPEIATAQDFEQSASAYRQAMADLQAIVKDHADHWTEPRRSRLELYHTTRARMIGDKDTVMSELHLDLVTFARDAETRAASFTKALDGGMDRSTQMLRGSLAALGAYLGHAAAPEIAGGADPRDLVARDLVVATDLRAKWLDGKDLRFSHDGPFTTAYCLQLAHAMGVDTKARGWINQFEPEPDFSPGY